MNKFLGILFVLVFYFIFAAISGWLGWSLLDEFDLAYGTWFNIAFVGIMIVRSGVFLEELGKDLTK